MLTATERQALEHFGLSLGLPQSTHNKTTVRRPVVLPRDMTITVRRIEAVLRGEAPVPFYDCVSCEVSR